MIISRNPSSSSSFSSNNSNNKKTIMTIFSPSFFVVVFIYQMICIQQNTAEQCRTISIHIIHDRIYVLCIWIMRWDSHCLGSVFFSIQNAQKISCTAFRTAMSQTKLQQAKAKPTKFLSRIMMLVHFDDDCAWWWLANKNCITKAHLVNYRPSDMMP